MSRDDIIAFAFFTVIILITLGITYWAAKKNTSTDSHYVAEGKIKPWQNGLAISSDYLSAASFLGIAGAIALSGFSGFYLSIGFLVAYLTVLLLVAEPLRNLGRYTVGDALAARFNTKGVRSASALNTLAISMFYMIAQLIGAGALINLLIPAISFNVSVIIVSVLMTIYVVAGGMIATTWIQIVKALLLVGGSIFLAIAVLAQFNFNPVTIFNEVEAQVGRDAVIPSAPGAFVDGLDAISLSLALVLGTAGLPHILIRFLTVPDAKAARSSIIVATWVIGGFYLLTPILGYGATLIVGRDAIAAADEGGNLAAPLLAGALGGPFFLAFISAAAFAAILSTVAGLVIAASGAFAHDFYTNVIRGGQANEREQLRAARLTALGISILAIILALVLQGENVAFLVALAFAVAASANVPVIVLLIFWRKFNTAGAITGMLTGLISSVVLVILSPIFLGDEGAIFPLSNPGLVSIPLGFLGCLVGTLLGGKNADREMEEGTQIDYDEIYVRANTGISNIEEELEEVKQKTQTN